MRGLSTMVSISFGIALVAGRTRVPRPATGNTALRIFMGVIGISLEKSWWSGFAVGSRFAAANKGQCGKAVLLPQFGGNWNRLGKNRHVKLSETASRPPECLKSGATAGDHDSTNPTNGKACDSNPPCRRPVAAGRGQGAIFRRR